MPSPFPQLSPAVSPRTPSWRLALCLATALWLAAFAATVLSPVATAPAAARPGWALALGLVLHLPYLAILALLCAGLVERAGYLLQARRPPEPGRLPPVLPKVCVQLPMFNEDAVAERVIAAAAAFDWPDDRLEIQILDDSTDPALRARVEAAAARVRRDRAIACEVIHRQDRKGYKAGALEAGRRRTDADFIANFDADFVPGPDFLRRTVPFFHDADGQDIADLALVQVQWGHLNDAQSPLTAAQALWVDDHHTLQMSWRSAALGFVNFTGTAGVWRAAAIARAGGWRAASLVEDCELSFRVLFTGYRTRFVKSVVAPAELPQTMPAYRLQQKRWTQGWVQVQRLHLAHLLWHHPAPRLRKAFLICLMCIGWQWPLWLLWLTLFPFLIVQGLWLGEVGLLPALALYLMPPLGFALVTALGAAIEARETYRDRPGARGPAVARRVARVLPFLVVNAGMVPHHVCAFLEGLFGPIHAEFERTPKTAATTGDAAPARALTAPRQPWGRPAYLAVEGVFVATQMAWIGYFLIAGPMLSAVCAGLLVASILGLRLAGNGRSPLIRLIPGAHRRAAATGHAAPCPSDRVTTTAPPDAARPAT